LGGGEIERGGSKQGGVREEGEGKEGGGERKRDRGKGDWNAVRGRKGKEVVDSERDRGRQRER
jgi:hypothetical protein